VINVIKGHVWFGGDHCGWSVMLLLVGYVNVSGFCVEVFGQDGWWFDSGYEGTKECLKVI